MSCCLTCGFSQKKPGGHLSSGDRRQEAETLGDPLSSSSGVVQITQGQELAYLILVPALLQPFLRPSASPWVSLRFSPPICSVGVSPEAKHSKDCFLKVQTQTR